MSSKDYGQMVVEFEQTIIMILESIEYKKVNFIERRLGLSRDDIIRISKLLPNGIDTIYLPLVEEEERKEMLGILKLTKKTVMKLRETVLKNEINNNINELILRRTPKSFKQSNKNKEAYKNYLINKYSSEIANLTGRTERNEKNYFRGKTSLTLEMVLVLEQLGFHRDELLGHNSRNTVENNNAFNRLSIHMQRNEEFKEDIEEVLNRFADLLDRMKTTDIALVDFLVNYFINYEVGKNISDM
ncbi:hypothetical protein ABN702_07620 [Bacillus haimaensis]|uniref:hypothetical protein n=1 Tax=Bacillus haimaensis TaxID=3160967 RepID=UPI003AA81D9E